MKKIAVLTSGKSRGSNFLSIATHLKNLPIEISFVLITKKNPPIKEKCDRLKIETFFNSTKNYSVFENQLSEKIIRDKIDLVVLAGFMKKISESFIHNIKIPIINIHPALLPKFGGKGMFGMNVHNAVFLAKESKSGATVHYLNENYDDGNIIEQMSVDISDCKSPEEISNKVLKIEHLLYPQIIEKLLV